MHSLRELQAYELVFDVTGFIPSVSSEAIILYIQG